MKRLSAHISTRAFLLLLILAPTFGCMSCAEISEANDSFYDSVFERSRQRRIEKDMANLKAGRRLQYHRSAQHLYEAKRTGRD